jgi:hypothetical protein
MFGRFLSAWYEDWTARMSGIASVILLFWATFWPPSQEQAKHGLLALCVICFVVGSYRIWAKQYQRVCDLTGKAPTEAIYDLIAEFEKLGDWYGSDEKTSLKPLEELIEESLGELRRHVPLAVYRFKKVATDPTPPANLNFLPRSDRTVEQYAEWRADSERELCWRRASACLNSLKDISREFPH